MTTFDKREEAFEQQFAHDEELRFKATARRNKLLGLWAAEKLGLTGADADSYALSVVMAAFEDKAAHDVLARSARISTPRASINPTTRSTVTNELMAQGGRQDSKCRSGNSQPTARPNNSCFNGRSPWPSPPLLSHDACTQVKPYSPAGAACPIRSLPKRWPVTALPQSLSKASTAYGTPPASSPASRQFARAARRRSYACPLAISPWSAASLDFGAEGIIAPMINTAADARAFAAAAKFPPLGERSWGPHRAMTLGGVPDMATYLREANDHVITLAMIETRTALQTSKPSSTHPASTAFSSDPPICRSRSPTARTSTRCRRRSTAISSA